MTTRQIIAHRIRQARLSRDWTQEYAAERIGVSSRAWVKYEASGGVPTPRLVDIARLFNLSLDWFVTEDDSMALPKAESPGARAKKRKAA